MGFFLWGLIVFFSLCIAKCCSLFKWKQGVGLESNVTKPLGARVSGPLQLMSPRQGSEPENKLDFILLKEKLCACVVD